jgi:hypothetical protein
MGQTNGNGRGQLQWGRADRDGAPMRSHQPLLLTEEEAEERLTRVADPHNQIFDTTDPEQNAAYLAVLDKVCNGWAKWLSAPRAMRCAIKRKYPDGTVEIDYKIKVYAEWAEIFMEDGTPMASQHPYIGRPNDD